MSDRAHISATIGAAALMALALAAPAPAQEVLPDPGGEEGQIPSGPLEEEQVEPEADLSVGDEGDSRLDGLFAELGNPDNANWKLAEVQIWRAWSRSDSPSMNLLLRRGGEAADRGEFDVALEFLDDLVRLAPDFAEGWNKRATVHFMQDDLGRSIADIERALALEPRHFGALSGLAIILERTGNDEGALRVWRRALEVHPHLETAAQAVDRLTPVVEGRRL